MLSLAQVAISVNVVVSKHIVHEMPVYILLAMRFMTSSILLSVMMVRSPRFVLDNQPETRLTRNDIMNLLMQALTAGFLFNLLFLLGLERTTATSAGIISASLPAIMAVMAHFFLRDYLTIRKVQALAIACLGITMIGLDNGLRSGVHGNLAGDLLIFLAMFPEAIYTVFAKISSKRIHPLANAWFVNVACFLMVLPLAWFYLGDFHFTSLSLSTYGFVVLVGFAGFTFFWCWSLGLTTINASTAALFCGLLPLSTGLLAALFLGERIGVMDSIGMLLVISSIVLGSMRLTATEEN